MAKLGEVIWDKELGKVVISVEAFPFLADTTLREIEPVIKAEMTIEEFQQLIKEKFKATNKVATRV